MPVSVHHRLTFLPHALSNSIPIPIPVYLYLQVYLCCIPLLLGGSGTAVPCLTLSLPPVKDQAARVALRFVSINWSLPYLHYLPTYLYLSTLVTKYKQVIDLFNVGVPVLPTSLISCPSPSLLFSPFFFPFSLPSPLSRSSLHSCIH